MLTRIGLAVVWFATVLLVLLTHATPVAARIRAVYDDEEIVRRSEVIVVARLKPGSIRFVVHPRGPDDGWSWEHHATLVVTEVLKGNLKKKEIPVTLHYGLSPVVGGKFLYKSTDKGLMAVEPVPTGRIVIRDTADSGMRGDLPIRDARDDNLWFLRKGIGAPGLKVDAVNFGIVDREDLQPLALRDYFMTYLAPDFEKAVRDYAAGHPEVRKRAQRTLDHAEIGRIVRLPDVKERTRKLVPYFLAKPDRLGWKTQQEAEKALLDCGQAAGPVLLELFDKVGDMRRKRILPMLGRIRYAPAVDRLLALVAEHEMFWDGYDVQPGWWNDSKRPAWGRSRQVYSEMLFAVRALEKIGAARTKDTTVRARERLRKLGTLMKRH